jgi:pyruvate decarboxylase
VDGKLIFNQQFSNEKLVWIREVTATLWYARVCGAGAAVVTFSVGGLSAINAIGSAYAENLPVILISGAPSTNDRSTEHLLHHTLATHDFSYQIEIAKRLSAAAVAITTPIEAPHRIDYAIRTALRARKPAYIEIACNIAAAPCAEPGPISTSSRKNEATRNLWRPPSPRRSNS